MMRLVGVARDNLKDTSHQVKCRCLQLISELYPIYPEADRTVEMVIEAEAVVKLLGDYSNAEVSLSIIDKGAKQLWVLPTSPYTF